MSGAVLIVLLVVGALVGGLLALRSSTRTGMPSRDVLDRAKRRERELEDEEKRGDARRDGESGR